MITCKIAAYLFGLAAGYWVLTLADKQKNATRTIGKWVGWIILVVSVCGMLCAATCSMCCRNMPGCKMGGWGCPMAKSETMKMDDKFGCPQGRVMDKEKMFSNRKMEEQP